MKEKPILFNTDMVRAILAGRKTQTRRIARRQPAPQQGAGWSNTITRIDSNVEMEFYYVRSEPVDGSYENGWEWKILETAIPPCAPGDRLWVCETWAWYGCERLQDEVLYRADGVDLPAEFGRWHPSIHMPRWASRILLEVTGVRVERLQDISDEDALAEGLKTLSKDGGRTFKTGLPDRDGLPDGDGWPWRAWEEDPRRAYKRLWESIYGPNSWAQNPWVWVIEFRRVEP